MRRRQRKKGKVPSEKFLRLVRRRSAVSTLNALAKELQLGVEPLRVKERMASVITRRVRLLEPRCQDGNLPQRLRAAVEQWSNNGGKLTREVLPPANNPASLPTGDAPELDSDYDEAVATLPLHKVLDPSFRLQSKAFYGHV